MTKVDLTPYTNKKALMMELQLALATLRIGGVSIAAILHGEDKRTVEVRRYLRRYKSEGRAKCLLYGEHLHTDSVADRYLSERYPVLLEEESDAGVTYIEFA